MGTMLCRSIGMSDQQPRCLWGLAAHIVPTVSRSKLKKLWGIWGRLPVVQLGKGRDS
jgi:hypothetical protein